MNNLLSALSDNSPVPVAIGGVGGSGTRIVAGIIHGSGYQPGVDLNVALDNLWFTLLFKYREAVSLDSMRFHRLYDIFRTAMTSSADNLAIDNTLVSELLAAERVSLHDREWLLKRLSTLSGPKPDRPPSRWGWKEPNTHMFIDRLINLEPGIHYIHVMRNGLDMAYSINQSQLKLWGPVVLGERFEYSPCGSLRFWRWAHERVLDIAESMGSQFLLVNFDALCQSPETEVLRIFEYLNIDANDELINKLTGTVRIPDSFGRHRYQSKTDFDPEDIDFVERQGFSVYWP